MKIEVTCKTYIDVPVSIPDCWNSDTIMEYKEDLYKKEKWNDKRNFRINLLEI